MNHMTIEHPAGALAEAPDNMAAYSGRQAVDERPLRDSRPTFRRVRIKIGSAPNDGRIANLQGKQIEHQPQKSILRLHVWNFPVARRLNLHGPCYRNALSWV